MNNEIVKTPLAYIGVVVVAAGVTQLAAGNFVVGVALLLVGAGVFVVRGYLKQKGVI